MGAEEIKYKAIIYTDGSCVLPRGECGGGAHGYLIDEECYKKNGDKPNKYEVTDVGYCEKHEMVPSSSEKDSIPRIVKPKFYFNAVYPYGLNGTNNIAELAAVIDSIHVLTESYPLESILFCTDSMYVINIYNAVIKDLVNREWQYSDRPNLTLWSRLADAITAHSDIKIELKKVKAHGTAIGNNVADRLAFAAREMSANNVSGNLFKFYEGQYWKAKPKPHPMLNFKQIYFNVGLQPDANEHMYVIMDYPTTVEVGKKSNEPIFGISIFKEPVVEIDTLTDMYVKSTNGLSYITALDLRVLYTQECSKMFDLLGVNVYNSKRGVIKLLGETNIVTPITPPGLAQNALVNTLAMYKIYSLYLNGARDDELTHVVDITEQLYGANDKGKLVFKHDQNIDGPEILVNIEDKPTKIILCYGKDILTINQLRALAKTVNNISIVIRKASPNMFEYYIIIDTKDAIGVYGNYYINKIYI